MTLSSNEIPFCRGSNLRIQLYYSPDLGVSWTQVYKYISDFSWAPGLTDADPKQIFVVTWADQIGDQTHKLSRDRILVRTRTLFRDAPDVLQRNVAGFLDLNEELFVANYKNDASVAKKLVVSLDHGDTWIEANFPLNLDEYSYTILDDSEGSVFINVRHGTSTWGNVYTAPSLQEDYTMALKYNVVRLFFFF